MVCPLWFLSLRVHVCSFVEKIMKGENEKSQQVLVFPKKKKTGQDKRGAKLLQTRRQTPFIQYSSTGKCCGVKC